MQNVNEVSSRAADFDAITWRDSAYRYTNRLAEKTTAVCEAAVRRYVEVGAFHPDEIVAVPNSVTVSRFTRNAEAGAQLRRELGLDGKIVGLMVSRMEPPKDHALLLRAWSAARTKYPNLHLVLVGDGPERAQL